MAAIIELTSASSNMEGYLNGWSNGFSSNYGAFWSSSTGLTTSPSPSATYENWGAGQTGGKGIVLDGEMQYSQGNLTGSVDTITLGTGYSQSSSGIGVSQSELIIHNDSSYSLAQQDLLDWAIYDLTVNSSISSLYDYLAAVGTVIEDTGSSDTLVGFGGADTFVFSGGNDTVKAGGTGTYGYQDGTDTLDVSDWGATSFGQLSIVDFQGDAIVAYNGNSVTLDGVSSSVLDASDFLFA